jgi:hypothetical protein
MKNKYPFKVKLRKDEPAFLTTKWKKTIRFDFTWQGKTYKAEYWWNSDGKDGVEWLYDKPNFGEKEDEIIIQLLEYLEENIDKDNINFITIEEI